MVRSLTSATIGIALALTSAAAFADVKKGDANELICKREKQTSTRFTKRTCMTKAQWDAMAEENRRNYSEMRDRPVIETRRDG